MNTYSIIKNKAQYKDYCTRLMELGAKKPSTSTMDEMELLELLIDKWEKDHLKNEEMDPIQLLKYLMQNHQVERSEMMQLLDISKGTLSKILNYKKGLSKKVIRILSEHFKVSQEAFNRPYPIKSDVNKGHKDEKMMNTKKEIAEV